MSQKKKGGPGYWIGAGMHIIGYLAAFGLTATCTFLLFSHYAPAGVLWIPFLAIAIVEYGSYKWWHHAKYNAENLGQLLIAILLGIASVIGISACTGLEMSSWFGIDIKDQWKGIAYLYVIILAVLQVVGYLSVGIVSNKNLSRWVELGLFRQEEGQPESVRIVEAEPSNKIAAPSDKFEDMQISPNTGPMAAVNGNIKKKQGGATQMTP